MKKILFLLGVACNLASAIGQVSIDTTDYQRAEAFISSNITKKYYRSWVNPQWVKDATFFWYSINTKNGTEYIKCQMKNGSKSPLFDQQKLAKLLATELDKTVEPYKLPITSIEIDKTGKTLTFKANKLPYSYQIKQNTLQKIVSKKTQQLASTSPDKAKTAVVHDYNLWLKTGNDSVQVTQDGTRAYGYGVSPSWYSTKNIELESDLPLELNISWSPDSKYIIAGKYDRREARNLYLYKVLPDEGHRAEVREYERPIAGDSIVPTVEFILIDVEKNSYQLLDIPAKATFLAYGFNWTKDGSRAYQVSFVRGYQSVDIYEVTAASSQVRTVFTESAATYVDPNTNDLRILDASNELLWLSERDGWQHIYRINQQTGQVINQVTKGTYVVRGIEHIDEKSQRIYFTAGDKEPGIDPYYPLLYSIRFDGTGLTQLTHEAAHHTVFFSTKGDYFVDNYSTVEEPNIAVLRRSKDGRVMAQLEQGDISKIIAMGWQKPEPFKVKGRDGKTDIYGVLFKPNNFDPNQKYPVIEGTYSGPQTIRAPKTFYRGLSNDDTPMTQLGFVMVNIDGMGSAFRSKAFHDVSYKNLGDIGGPDKMIAIKTLAGQYPWIDTTRVGIFGHSAGGYDAARALLAYPEFYKVGVATAGNHDHRSAKAWWPELYMGYPAGKNYDDQSNYTHAKNLQGNLLLVHGDQDQNVNPTASMRLAAELIKANKDFELLLIPNKDHSQVYYDKYLIRKRWDFFVKHLHGIQPPKNYQIK
ncbi:DPP IV N-terminal domain-containing protein [Carboxylicivirga mesophila]|uniref:DPP IV N-terminal domain-containing protein n=1 Tax=Carboxylicivirga mesophila TaxID=1166478 RepID=A0ABS5K8W1_9BACT|nr:DPP IV N-terminal domain-containing protein [Carboxylicivirga mesophila]MBS2211439.1 DPP IV N-terminal domain-containing protein [Carboxylicivirga mesophila]